ncbi:MAG: hypothetical protein ACOYN0_18000, partial [Phycisphaerales bacterium]
MLTRLLRFVALALLAPAALAQECGTWLPGASVPGFTADMRVVDLFVPAAGSPTYVIASGDQSSGGVLYTVENNTISPFSTNGLGPSDRPSQVIEFDGSIYLSTIDPGNIFPPTLSRGAIYRWEGTQWVRVASSWISTGAMVVHAGRLCFAATWREIFQGFEIFPVGVLAYDGVSFEELARFNQRPATLASMNGVLYAGGAFTEVTPRGQSPRTANYIAQWDGAAWGGVNFSALNGAVERLVVFNANPLNPFPSLLVFGQFTSASGFTANHAAAWDPAVLPDGDWSPLAGGVGFPAGTTAVTWSALPISVTFNNNDMLVGVSCRGAQGTLSAGIQRWTGSAWQPYTSSSGPVLDMVFANGVVAGGDFTRIGALDRYNIARFDGSGWQAVGRGTDGAIYDLVELGGTLYAGGAFTQIEGVDASRVAAHDATGWRALGAGLNDEVTCLEVFNGQLYAGGLFTASGATTS